MRSCNHSGRSRGRLFLSVIKEGLVKVLDSFESTSQIAYVNGQPVLQITRWFASPMEGLFIETPIPIEALVDLPGPRQSKEIQP